MRYLLAHGGTELCLIGSADQVSGGSLLIVLLAGVVAPETKFAASDQDSLTGLLDRKSFVSRARERLAAGTESFSGADLAHVCRTAAQSALVDAARTGSSDRVITTGDLEAAISAITCPPSLINWRKLSGVSFARMRPLSKINTRLHVMSTSCKMCVERRIVLVSLSRRIASPRP